MCSAANTTRAIRARSGNTFVRAFDGMPRYTQALLFAQSKTPTDVAD